MEKIKFTGEISAGLVASACANKINEIIDEFQTIRIERTNIDTVTKEDRLKTLEDKIENVRELLVRSKLIRPEDLWDEQNEPKISDIGEIEKHSTCKHTPIYSGKCCKECEPTVNIPEKVMVVVGKKEDWGETLEAKDEFEPTVKECDSKGNIVMNSNPLVDELLEKYNKDQKIEEIIKSIYTDFDNKLYTRNDFESWLRDKLRDICK